MVGRVIQENELELTLMTDPIHPNKEVFRKADIVSRHASKISPMPDGLVSSMTEDEIWDLIAYMESGGKKSNAAFKK